MRISIVIPMHNEAGNVKMLAGEIVRAMRKWGRRYEVVVVDDGSDDETWVRLKRVAKKDKRWTVVSLRKRFGQTAALAAGFARAKGELVVSMDGDLQNDASDIGKLVAKIEEGYDVVSGWRRERKGSWWKRRLPSVVANWVIAKISGVELHDFGCTLKVYRREVLDEVALYGEMHRLIPAMAAAVGAKVAEVEVVDRKRRYGVSKYGMGRTGRVILDVVTLKYLLDYSTRPIHLFGGMGLLMFGVGGGGFLWLVWERVVRLSPLSDRPVFLVTIFLMLVGIQLVTIGLLAEIMMRVYYEAGKKPTYFVREEVGGAASS